MPDADAIPREIPGVGEIRAAQARLAGLIVETPLVEAPALSEKFGGRVLFKPEVLQRTGSFKFRGAYNKIASLPEDRRGRGVVAFSSGNHAQGVAAAAAMFGVEAVIAMPADAPGVKVANVRRMGAEVIFFDRFRDSRLDVVRPYTERGMALVPPFDDPMIIAGQGTIGLELVAEATRLGIRLDTVVVPCGGGGLSSGIATAVKEAFPEAAVLAAEPENFDDMKKSLRSGVRVSNDPGHSSICDAILTSEPGIITFEINRKLLAGSVAVSDDATRAAMRDAATHLKLVVEPGGCVALAALSSGEIALEGRTTVVVLSGGNADLAAYAEILASA